MTIDTSREAVERLNTHRVYIDRTMCFDEGVTWTTVAGLYPHAYVPEDFALALLARAEAAEAERDAALAEVARLSTPPDDAEVAGLVMKARDGLCTKPKGGPFGPGWSVDLSATVELLNAMADALTRLSHAHAAGRKLEDDLARALDYARGGIACGAEEALARHAARRKG